MRAKTIFFLTLPTRRQSWSSVYNWAMSWKLHGSLECLNTHILPLSITARIHQHSPPQVSALDPHNCWVSWKLWFSNDPQHQARVPYHILLAQGKTKIQNRGSTKLVSFHIIMLSERCQLNQAQTVFISVGNRAMPESHISLIVWCPFAQSC